MKPKWKVPEGRYVLRIRVNQYLLKAGSYDEGNGQSVPCAQTTPRIDEAQGFMTKRRAEAMRQLLRDRYGLESRVIERTVWQ